MAIANDPRWRAFDANGNAYSGALLAIVDAGTSTPSTIFTDAALTIPSSNPVVADSNGIFPQWFGPEGNLYDIQKKTSGGVLIPGQSYVSVPAVGNQNSVLSRDFTTSRFQVHGAGGTTFIEVGDASPDNVGGTGHIGGWNATQADLITVDAAIFNVTGRIEENSKKLPSVVYTEATQFTAVTQVDIALPNDPVGCRAYDLEIFDYQQSGVGTLKMVFSYNGGSTYKTGATDYKWSLGVITGGSGLTSAVDTSDPSIQVSSSMAGLAGANGLLKLRIVTPNSGNDMTLADWDSSGIDAGGNYCTTRGFGYGGPTYGRVTNVRLLLTASTMTGKYLVRPGRGYGET